MTLMANYMTLLWQRMSAQDSKPNAEVERLAVLQRTAASRRAEYAEMKAQAALIGEASPPGPLASSRKRMEEAEAAHTAALQAWENKQSRQKSR